MNLCSHTHVYTCTHTHFFRNAHKEKYKQNSEAAKFKMRQGDGILIGFGTEISDLRQKVCPTRLLLYR